MKKNLYDTYLTKKEKNKINEIEQHIRNAKTVKEVQLYKEQIGLIIERILIRMKYEKKIEKSKIQGR